MTTTIEKPPTVVEEIEDHADRFGAYGTPKARHIGLLSLVLHHLEIRALSALYRSDDGDQALEIIQHAQTFREPIHRQMAERVSLTWASAHKQGKTLADALHALDDEEAWWIRCQLPTGVSELTSIEHRARGAVAELWEEVSRG